MHHTCYFININCNFYVCLSFVQTGTLTEDSLEVSGVVKCLADDTNGPLLDNSISPVTSLSNYNDLMIGLAVCHDLTYVQGKLIGDPMDIKMFESTNWVSKHHISNL